MIYDPIAKRSINSIPTKRVVLYKQNQQFKLASIAISSDFKDSYFYSFMLSFL